MSDICRGCGATGVFETFADLGSAPPANALLSQDQLDHVEIHYPLRAVVCNECSLVQLPALIDSQTLFPDDYPFRSGLSKEWVAHCEKFATQAITDYAPRNVLELGSNDGSGLVAFQKQGIRVLGVDPGVVAAKEANCNGISTFAEPWTTRFARELSRGYTVDMVIGRNVLAHVSNLDDFLVGIRHVLSLRGVAVFEVPYICNLIQDAKWDQIYHEHHCYFSIKSIRVALEKRGLHVFDVEFISTHGGSIRVYATTADFNNTPSTRLMAAQRAEDKLLSNGYSYPGIQTIMRLDRLKFWEILNTLYGQHVIGYGASAKAVTFLNYCGIKRGDINSIVDITPAKQGKYTPGGHIPIAAPKRMDSVDTVINFCWNWKKASEQNIRDICPRAQIVYPMDRTYRIAEAA